MTHTSMEFHPSLGHPPRDATLLAEQSASEGGWCTFTTCIWRATNGTLGTLVLEQCKDAPEPRQVIRFDEATSLAELDRLLYLHITSNRTEPPRPTLLQVVAAALDQAAELRAESAGQ